VASSPQAVVATAARVEVGLRLVGLQGELWRELPRDTFGMVGDSAELLLAGLSRKTILRFCAGSPARGFYADYWRNS
jgi:hypothetical protein